MYSHSTAEASAVTSAQLHVLLASLKIQLVFGLWSLRFFSFTYGLLRDDALVGGRGSRAGGLHGDSVGVPGVLLRAGLSGGGRLEDVEVEHGDDEQEGYAGERDES